MSDEKLSPYESSEAMLDVANKPFEFWEKIINYLSCNPVSQGVISSIRNILG